MYKIMTPGPTQVAENVRIARSWECTNPDLDESFVEFYKNTCDTISGCLNTDHETIILDGEGILALEAACASLIEPGDRVLVLDNGIYGSGFADFVTMYGGAAELYTRPADKPLDSEELKCYLTEHHDYKIATLVHCDTPSAMLNDAASLCSILKSYGILTIVDAVSSMFGEPVDPVDMDILCGGSQKAISAPPGLSFVVLSPDAKAKIKERKTPIPSFYANLKVFFTYYEDKWFPYTMPISDIYGLAQAMENIKKDAALYQRHADCASYTRDRLRSMGLTLYPAEGYSNTVTSFLVPDGMTDKEILGGMLENHNIMLAGRFGTFGGKLIRIGHMGTNATMENVMETLDALEDVLRHLQLKGQENKR